MASAREDGTVDWLASLVFKMHRRDGHLHKVTHCSGDIATDLDVLRVHEGYALENPCSDQGA